MDSKTKHRILGFLVIAGLVVILLPFLQSGRELSPVAAVVKTPPFPDQSVQVTSVTPLPSDIKQQPDDTIKTDHVIDTTKSVPQIINPVIDQKPESPQSNNSNNQDLKSTPVNAEAEALDKVVTPDEPAVPNVKKVAAMPKHSHVKPKHVPYTHGPLDNNGLFKLQGASYVIQVGSFKSKANALRVVNNLRANGYRAFIQQISSSLGDNTRVFVGPENKQSTARELAQRIESDMHLRGIVISYQPLAL